MDRIGEIISITLVNGFWYKGVILEEDDTQIVVRDLKNKRVEIPKSSVLSMQEEEKIW